jgi:hypothetical protein
MAFHSRLVSAFFCYQYIGYKVEFYWTVASSGRDTPHLRWIEFTLLESRLLSRLCNSISCQHAIPYMILLSSVNPYTESGAFYWVIKKEALLVHVHTRIYRRIALTTLVLTSTTLMKQGRPKSRKIPPIHDFCGSSPVIFAEDSPRIFHNFSQLFL